MLGDMSVRVSGGAGPECLGMVERNQAVRLSKTGMGPLNRVSWTPTANLRERSVGIRAARPPWSHSSHQEATGGAHPPFPWWAGLLAHAY